MTRVEEIESAVAGLPQPDFTRFRDWFLRYDAESWDRQLEQDATSGRLDGLAEEAIQDFHAGRCKEL